MTDGERITKLEKQVEILTDIVTRLLDIQMADEAIRNIEIDQDDWGD